MPSGRRMSSAWIIVSPSQVVFGPGGDFFESAWLRKFEGPERVAAEMGPDPSSANLGKLNPETMKPAKNFGGVICAVDVMCASTSPRSTPRTARGCPTALRQPARSSASAPRSRRDGRPHVHHAGSRVLGTRFTCRGRMTRTCSSIERRENNHWLRSTHEPGRSGRRPRPAADPA